MKRLAMSMLAIVLLPVPAPGAEPAGLEPYHWLAGEWRGTGEGQPGNSATERRIDFLIGDRYLRFFGRSVYPKQEANPRGEIHDQMDVWSFDKARDALVIRQFNNLGFVSTYVLDRAASSDQQIVLNAEHLENVPKGWRARYTYTFVPPDEYHELFELDFDGAGFRPYVLNRFLRVK